MTEPTNSKQEKKEMEGVRRPTVVDLFSGAGGFGLGFEQAGFDLLAAFDNDPVHVAVHDYNFPRTEAVCRDLATVSSGEVLRAARRGWTEHGRSEGEWDGELDVLIGGPPCQGFSHMGYRDPSDDRNDLVHQFFRLVTELQPRYFVMENVPGLKFGEFGDLLDELIDEYERSGYSILQPVRTLNAADFGVPQDRERLFLVGAREGETEPSYPPPTVEPVPKRPSAPELFEVAQADGNGAGLPIGPTVSDAIGDLPNLDEFDQLVGGDSVALEAETVREMKRDASEYAARLMGIEADPADYSYDRSDDLSVLTSSKRTQHQSTSVERFADTDPGETESVSKFYRLHPMGLSNTLRAGTGAKRGAHTAARPIHPEHPRVISVREAARLHSFPDWFRLHVTKWHGFRQVGNAVPPLLGRAVGAEILAAIDCEPTSPDVELSLGEEDLLQLSPTAATEAVGADPAQTPGKRDR